MNILIRNVNPIAIKKIDATAAKKGISREEFFRHIIERTAALDDIIDTENRYSDLVEKTVACIRAQSEELQELKHAIWKLCDQTEERKEDSDGRKETRK